MLFVRHTLSNINNSTPVFTGPKTHSSRAWIGLSDRVVAALQRQAARQPGRELVFTRRDGLEELFLRLEVVVERPHSDIGDLGDLQDRNAPCTAA